MIFLTLFQDETSKETKLFNTPKSVLFEQKDANPIANWGSNHKQTRGIQHQEGNRQSENLINKKAARRRL